MESLSITSASQPTCATRAPTILYSWSEGRTRHGVQQIVAVAASSCRESSWIRGRKGFGFVRGIVDGNGGFLKEGALCSKKGDLSGRSLILPAGGLRYGSRSGNRRVGGKMATMAVPRSMMEDSGADVRSLIDVEAPDSEYGTFSGANGKDYGEARAAEDTWISSVESSPEVSQWDSTTARLADSATAAFLLLQLPQIFLNMQNLIAGNYAALAAVPWMGQLTGLLGNLSLLSYFASKKERGAMVVQAVGVVSTLVVLSQLALANAMPRVAFTVVASVVGIGLTLNFLNYNNKLSREVWRVWGESVSIGGVTVLPQVMWSTFEPQIPHSNLPAAIFGTLAVSMIVLARLDKLPPKAKNFVGSVSAWTATLLFMWAPVVQWWTNYLYPANIKGLSVFTVLLAMIGNSLLLPRALFTRDLMWFTGSGWGSLFQGWGILVSMYIVQAIGDLTFWAISAGLFLWLSTMLWKDSKAFHLSSPFMPLIELISGKRA